MRAEQLLVEHVALEQRHAGIAHQIADELMAAGAEVVDDHDLDAVRPQPVGQVRADEAGPAGDASALHPGLETEACGDRVAVEHLHGLERVLL